MVISRTWHASDGTFKLRKVRPRPVAVKRLARVPIRRAVGHPARALKRGLRRRGATVPEAGGPGSSGQAESVESPRESRHFEHTIAISTSTTAYTRPALLLVASVVLDSFTMGRHSFQSWHVQQNISSRGAPIGVLLAVLALVCGASNPPCQVCNLRV
jgi:hypothetical protein